MKLCEKPAKPKDQRNRRQRGQALLEYAFLVGLTAAIALGLSVSFRQIIQRWLFAFNANLEQELESGSYPGRESIWEN
ncbi:MAG: hypothetical protein AB1540_16895 [Bdellovibrionota bacterium]